MASSLWVLKPFTWLIPTKYVLNTFKSYPAFCSHFTHWVHGGYFVKVPTKGPSGYFLSKTDGFFHNLLSNVPITNLSHSLRVLSKSTHSYDHNVPSGFFWKNSWRNLNVAQFYHKLSKNSLSIWLITLWSDQWVLFERTLNEWLRFVMGTLESKLWKNPWVSLKKYPLGPLVGKMWAKCRVIF